MNDINERDEMLNQQMTAFLGCSCVGCFAIYLAIMSLVWFIGWVF